MTAAPLSIALLGSGEFEDWTEPVDRWLLDRAAAAGAGDGRILILPTASAPEGDEVFDRWGGRGHAHYARLGIDAHVVPLKTREDADRASIVRWLEGASMVFFSGGIPGYSSAVLAGSSFWQETREAMRGGLAYAGCSAGVACLGEVAPDSAARLGGEHPWRPGLRLFPQMQFGPHWDALDDYIPGLKEIIVASVPSDHRLLAIDEHTAVIGDGSTWTVVGMGGASLYQDGTWAEHSAGSSFVLPFDVSSTLRDHH